MRNIFQLCGNPGNLADKLPVSLPCAQERKNNHWTIIMPTEPWLLISVTEFEHLLSISGTWSFYVTYLSPEQFRITASGEKKKISPPAPWLASQQKSLEARIRGYLQSQAIVLFFKIKIVMYKNRNSYYSETALGIKAMDYYLGVIGTVAIVPFSRQNRVETV